VAINWFEGGRRITKLLTAITVAIGAYSAYDFSYPDITFATTSPHGEWWADLPPEDAPEWAKESLACGPIKYLSDFKIKPDLVRGVTLCFLPNEQGQVVYYSGKEEEEQLKKVEIAITRAKASGEMDDARALSEEASRIWSILRKKGPGDLFGNAYDPEVTAYIDRRVSEFRVTPSMLAAIEKDLPRIERSILFGHLKMIILDTGYVIAALWIFSFLLGWIVRGFSGIPRGQDFRAKISHTGG
jgi:hypothetical protein